MDISQWSVQKAYDSTLSLLKNTAIEVIIVGALGAGVLINRQDDHETERAYLTPINFSEMGQIARDAKKEGKTLSIFNQTLPAYNDLLMKGIEAYNEGNRQIYINKYHGFAQELDNHLSLKNIYRHNLTALFEMVPQLGIKLKEELKEYYAAYPPTKQIATNIDNAWTKRYVDNYHYEDQPCGTDSLGNTIYCSVKVDDIDDTWYYYHNSEGEAASKISKELFTKIPKLNFDTKVITASKTQADGEYAAEKSRGVELKGGFTPEQHIELSAYWFTKSTLNANINGLNSKYPAMQQEANNWHKSKRTAEDKHYISWGEHAGPEEYDQAQEFASISNTNSKLLEEIVKNVNSIIEDVPKLHKKMQDYISLDFFGEIDGKHYELKEKNKLEKKMYNEIREDLFSMYRMNFKLAENPDRYRYGMVALAGVIGLIIGGALGAGVDYATTKFGLYNRISYNSLFKKSQTNHKDKFY